MATAEKGVNIDLSSNSDSKNVSSKNSATYNVDDNLKNDLNNIIGTMGPSTQSSKIATTEDEEPSSRADTLQDTPRVTDLYVADPKMYTSTTNLDSSFPSSKVEQLDSLMTDCEQCCIKKACEYPENISQSGQDYSEACGCKTTSDAQTDSFASNNPPPTALTVPFPCPTISRMSRLDKTNWMNWLKSKTISSKKFRPKTEYYKMNITGQNGDDESPPRRVIFDLVQESKPVGLTVGTNTTQPKKNQNLFQKTKNPTLNNKKSPENNIADNNNTDKPFSFNEIYRVFHKPRENIEKKIVCSENVYKDPARVDVYYFDHGNASYLRTTDNPPVVRTETIAEKSEDFASKFWAEVFGSVHIGCSFITSFILQFVKFLLQSVIRPLTVGLVQITSDYCIKPGLATLFNALIQPPLIFIYNIATSLRDICDPISEGIGYFLREVASVFKAFRFVDVKTEHTNTPSKTKNRKSGEV